MSAWRAEAGFSLAELLASTALMSVLMAATLTVLVAGQESYGLGAARIDAQQSARIALERMAKELREAGYDPTRAGLAAVVLAGPPRSAHRAGPGRRDPHPSRRGAPGPRGPHGDPGLLPERYSVSTSAAAAALTRVDLARSAH